MLSNHHVTMTTTTFAFVLVAFQDFAAQLGHPIVRVVVMTDNGQRHVFVVQFGIARRLLAVMTTSRNRQIHLVGKVHLADFVQCRPDAATGRHGRGIVIVVVVGGGMMMASSPGGAFRRRSRMGFAAFSARG